MSARLRRLLLGRPRDVLNPRTYHSISLAAVLAWVGLGADPLSSSAYGPDEAFRALGDHAYLAIALALATTFTVVTLSLAYSQIIRHFPSGGGGYTVASELLGPRFGVVSGSALVVDYILTISVSIASAGDQAFSALPPAVHAFKLPVEFLSIILLVTLNLRGVKESVTVLAPVFALFVATHLVLIVGGIGMHAGDFPRLAGDVRAGFGSGVSSIGVVGLTAVLFRAYAMGGGTYTGIEAVSNGLPIMREPKVATARRTMIYIAASLAITASGLLLCYLLFEVRAEPGKTLNAVLLGRFAGDWTFAGLPAGATYVTVTLLAEAALLFVAAQAGFIDGPRVMANMARDHWLPHRLTKVSERLAVQDGVLLMGVAAAATLLYTRGAITVLVTMYSINIFLTFSLSQLGMVRFWLGPRGRAERSRLRGLLTNGVALVMCAGLLVGIVYEKFRMGGWVTIVATTAVVALCFAIHRHYRGVQQSFRRLDDIMLSLPDASPEPNVRLDPRQPTAVLMVGGYSGLGIHALLSLERLFPGQFRNVVFASVATVDAGSLRGVDEVNRMRAETEQSLRAYVRAARSLGLAAEYRVRVATSILEEGEALARAITAEFPRAIFFMGSLVFEKDRSFGGILHNDTAYRLQRRLQFAGMNAMVLPVRVIEPRAPRSGRRAARRVGDVALSIVHGGEHG